VLVLAAGGAVTPPLHAPLRSAAITAAMQPMTRGRSWAAVKGVAWPSCVMIWVGGWRGGWGGIVAVGGVGVAVCWLFGVVDLVSGGCELPRG